MTKVRSIRFFLVALLFSSWILMVGCNAEHHAQYNISGTADIERAKLRESKRKMRGPVEVAISHDISEADWRMLTSTGMITRLSVQTGSFSPDEMRALASISSLSVLSLSDCDVSDSDIAYLAEMGNLRTLDLANTKVTDACIPSLLKIKWLREINLSNTGVTLSGIKTLANTQRYDVLVATHLSNECNRGSPKLFGDLGDLKVGE